MEKRSPKSLGRGGVMVELGAFFMVESARIAIPNFGSCRMWLVPDFAAGF